SRTSLPHQSRRLQGSARRAFRRARRAPAERQAGLSLGGELRGRTGVRRGVVTSASPSSNLKESVHVSEQPALLVERDGHIVTVTMNRPEARNALNPEMICRLSDAWDMIDSDDGVRVAILTGSHGHFCAGADLDKLVSRSLKGLPPENDFEQRIRDDYQVIFRGLLRSRRTIKPLIAAIEGSCIAGG